MATDRPTEMDAAEIAAFVGRGGTGVLSLAASNVPYATPVSYGFDPDERTFYFRLGFVEGSEKRRFLEASEGARFVVYDRTGDAWRSVVAVGTLERVPPESLTLDVARTLRRADPPLFDVWDVPPEAIDFELYRLVPGEVTGRTSAGDASS